MLNVNSKLGVFLKFLSLTKRIEREEVQLSRRISKRKEKLSNIFKLRYKKANDKKVEIQSHEINEELNLVLRSMILDDRIIIKIPGTWGSQKCITKRYGFKTYKCWSAAHLDLGNVSLDKHYVFKRYDSDGLEYSLNFGILIRNKYIDQKKIKDYFKFLKEAILLNQFYRLEIKSLENLDSNNDINLSDLKDFPESYQDLDSFKEKIESLDSLDELYEKFIIKISKFGKIQDEFLTNIKEYNKPFRLLLQLQESKL